VEVPFSRCSGGGIPPGCVDPEEIRPLLELVVRNGHNPVYGGRLGSAPDELVRVDENNDRCDQTHRQRNRGSRGKPALITQAVGNTDLYFRTVAAGEPRP
jgi:hypothetical protein